MRIGLPLLYSINTKIAKNPIQRVLLPSEEVEVAITSKDADRLLLAADDGREILVVGKGVSAPRHYTHVVRGNFSLKENKIDLDGATWLSHPLLPAKGSVPDYGVENARILSSWRNAFAYAEEDLERDIVGLRNPQLGAVHAVHGHWSVSSEPATVVMPTGTGKTETMLSILVSTPCPKLLVVVPTDALRGQLGLKFLTLGILKHSRSKVLDQNAERPIVCCLEHTPRSVEEVDEIFSSAHVVVTTSSIAGRCERAVQDRMAHHCPYVFVDEAHHAEAPTWRSFKERFSSRRVLQFTATPFREDGKALDGKIIFKYPLRKAQEDGYFKPITFKRVVEFAPAKADAAIAALAVKQLRSEVHLGHILMARVNSVARAEEVFKHYEPYAEFQPIQLHSRIASVSAREALRHQLLSGRSRIVVCVDMLGEGFDLPELKIAAFHDIRKSLAVTLQLAGRFTRNRPDLGNATFIANVADVEVQSELQKLYRMDPDWNKLLPEMSDRAIGEEQSFQDFLEGFSDEIEELSLRSLRPANSMVAYRTDGSDWAPENFKEGFTGYDSYERVWHDVNVTQNALIVVTLKKAALAWADVETLYDWQSELYVLIWSPEQRVLYINSSSNAGEYRALAQAVCGEHVVLINGNNIFRVFNGVERLRLQNVGLSEQLGRNIRYTGRMGADVEEALSELEKRNTTKSVLAGSGFANGTQVSVGASRKGRVWAHRRDRLDQLAAWCKNMGTKLIDDTINPDDILAGTLRVTYVAERPKLVVLGVDWPEEIYTEPENTWTILVDGQPYHFSELSIEAASNTDSGSLLFRITGDDWSVEFEQRLFAKDDSTNYSMRLLGKQEAVIRRGGHGDARGLESFFEANPPKFWFADGSSLEGCLYAQLRHAGPPYSAEKLTSWDWTGVDLTQESQGAIRKQGTIQHKVIETLMKRGTYDAIVDDDGSGEAADVVAIRVLGGLEDPQAIEVELYHCKYSSMPTPGQRIGDLYEVCGQAQKSIHWKYSPEKSSDLFKHLLRRDAMRRDRDLPGRINHGSVDLLQVIKEISRSRKVTLKIFVVQPGVSKAKATDEQLTLLAVSENYLWQTYQIPLEVIVSA